MNKRYTGIRDSKRRRNRDILARVERGESYEQLATEYSRTPQAIYMICYHTKYDWSR